MLTSELRDHLGMQFPSVKFFSGPNIPDYPNQMCIVTPAPGGGLSMESALDSPGWQLRMVGPQGDPNTTADAAEQAIRAIEQYLYTLPTGAKIGDTRVINAQRFGSQPTTLPVDTSDRVHYVVTVLIEVESGF